MSEIEEILEAAVLRKRGQSFHEFEVGEEIHHHWGRTITEADAIQFAHLTLAYNPLYFNREYAIELGHPDIVVCPQLVFNVILGLSVEICSEGLGGPFLGVYDLKYLEPVYPGDTLTSVSKTVAKRESESSEGRGVLTWFNEGFNQHDRKVIEYRRSNLAIWKGGLGAPKIKKENADGKLASLTSSDNYYEDFQVGQVIRHARGKTMTPLENVNITNMVMNTAQGHFNEDQMSKTPLGKILCYGGVNFSLVLGLASQDTVENALAELELNNIQLKTMVFHGDTIYAYSKVLEKRESDQEDAGIVVFKHYGINQNKELIAEVERTALIKKKSHWLDR